MNETTYRILLAEDDGDLRETIADLLSEHYEVEAVADGRAAIEAVLERPPNLVLADVTMPGLNGFELVAWLRENPRTSTLPIVMISARGSEAMRIEGIEHGADDYLVKPFSARELLARVRTHLSLATVRSEAAVRERALRETAESALRQLSLITDALPSLVAWVDSDYRYLFVNGTHEAWFGMKPEEMLGRTLGEIYGEAMFEQTRPWLDQALGGQRVTFETEVPTPGGPRFVLATLVPEQQSSPSLGGGGEAPHRVVMLVHDISTRIAAEEALRRSEERFQLARRATRDVIWDWDLGSDTLTRASTVVDLLGDLGEDISETGRSLGWWIERLHPEDQARVRASLEAAIAEPGDEWEQEYRVRRQDGKYVTVLDRGYLVRGPDGQALRMVGATTDVTQRREMERQVQAAQHMNSVGRLAGGVAHEVNNALTGVLGFASLLDAGLPPTDPRRDDVGYIIRSAERGAMVTQQLLAFSRRQMMVSRVLDLGRLVVEFEPLLNQALGAGVRLEVHRPEAPALVKADPMQLEQVLVNLALNAKDAMPRGGHFRVEVSVTPNPAAPLGSGEEVVLTVSDTGCGMDEQVLSQLFEPFFTTKPVGQGTGLGLSVVYGIVRQSGGRIEVESRPYAGSSFQVVLPRVEGVASEGPVSTPRKAAARPIGHGRRVLVLDDDPAVLSFFTRVLRGQGFSVLEATTVEEAHAHIDHLAGGVDLLIADLVLPGASGRDVVDRLLRTHPNTPVLYVSGSSADEMMGCGLLAPDAPFLTKPMAPDALTRIVGELILGKHAGGTATPGRASRQL